MGKRCQVCDGPIVDGRCKYCGMPYRSDAEMYHLNEDRSEHYRHASAKVRKAMRESEIPLPDRNKASAGTGKSRNVNVQKTQKQTAKAQNIKTQTAKKQTIGTRTTSQQNAGRQTAWSQPQTVQSQTARTYAGKSSVPAKKKKRKSKKAVIFWVILAGAVALIEYAPEYAERIGYAIENFVSDELGIDIAGTFSENTGDIEMPVSQEELAEYPSFYIDTDTGTCVVGESEIIPEEDSADSETDMQQEEEADSKSTESAAEETYLSESEPYEVLSPGEYVIESGWEAVALEITDTSGKTETVKFDKAKQQEKVELHTGYELTAVSLDEQYNYVAFYQIQQYDE